MESAGEKQDYVLALLETLFHHLPPTFTVGVLYDIISFTISVFHAFGHRWACQVVYHPHKCAGFGLSDSKGCERFWHSISKLIPFLQICRYHTCLYTVDMQIRHINKENLFTLGKWLEHKWTTVHQRLLEAEKSLKECGYTEQYLCEQWKAQAQSQTQLLPAQSRESRKNTILEVMHLCHACDLLQEKIKRLEDVMMDLQASKDEQADAAALPQEKRSQLKDIESRCRTKEQVLGVTKSQEIIEKLHARKFEWDRLERSYHCKKITNEQKLHDHIEDSVHKCDSSILALVRQYNQHCVTMADLIRHRKTPQNTVEAAQIDPKSIFALDIDNVITSDSYIMKSM
ncbi:hypothetical protein Moror_10728 [Moniliophthora roreri MCA 2997]|uniref:Uncharacterized protein n=1 Tax=Moniliophthora roreri (strain MCA 2997) TaxID=1381753 RepID=V2X5N7_MONRO|nr:hypothetical protein Moror_10728 [Moniliophthora roreri MCA 2997]